MRSFLRGFGGKAPIANGARAYTVVEVMMALAVLGLGASGVIAAQKATLIANTNARNLVAANAVAQAWMERMRVDALAWNEPGGVPESHDRHDVAGERGRGGAGDRDGVVLPGRVAGQDAAVPAGAPKADVMGADIYNGDPSAPAFCPQVRLTKFSSSSQANASPLWSYYRMIRVEVRVYWDKTGHQLDCTAALPANPQTSGYGFVYLASAVTENNSPI